MPNPTEAPTDPQTPAESQRGAPKPLAVPPDSTLETLPVLIPGSPLVPILIARQKTSAAHWLQLLRLIDRSGVYRSAVSAKLSGVSRCLAWSTDCERSCRWVENHTSQRLGIALTLTTVREADSLVRGIAKPVVAVVGGSSGVYLAGHHESGYRAEKPTNPRALKSYAVDPSRYFYPWDYFYKLPIDPSPSRGEPLAPLGWGDSRFSAGFSVAVPFGRSKQSAENISWDGLT